MNKFITINNTDALYINYLKAPTIKKIKIFGIQIIKSLDGIQ